MLQRPALFPRIPLLFMLSAPVVCIAVFLTGCDASNAERNAKVNESPVFTVQIERSRHDADRLAAEFEEQQRQTIPRELAFKVVGTAPKPEGDVHAEDRISASQAAIVDAFTRALIEARQSRGQSTENFTARLGPRMSVTHRSEDGSTEVRIQLTYRGVENTLAVRDGVLLHPPVDLRLIRRLFEETNGEFSLLATDTTSSNAMATATVACYLPAGFDPAVKNVAWTDGDIP